MEILIGNIIYLVLLLIVLVSYSCFYLYLRNKADGGFGNILKREIDFQIYYNNCLIKEGVFQLKNNSSVRFGYSKRREYYNNVVIEDYLEKIEEHGELDNSDVSYMEENYNTWFSVKMSAGKLWIVPAYTNRDIRLGNRRIFLEEDRGIRELNKSGEEFASNIAICSNDSNSKKSFKVIVYDRFEEIQ